MTDSRELQHSITSFLDLYIEGNFSDLRIKAESLLHEEIRSKARMAIEDTKILELCNHGSEPWHKCHDKWCRSPEDGLKCIQRQFLVTSLLDPMQNGNRLFFENVMILFWFFHASAYERWEDSFDYDSIGCLLHLARQVAYGAVDRISDPSQITVLECLQLLTIQSHHGVYIENAMICNSPESFQRHAEKNACFSAEIIEKLRIFKKDDSTGESNLDLSDQIAIKLTEYLEPVLKQHNALVLVGKLMNLRRTNRELFTNNFESTLHEIRQACHSLEEVKDFEGSSELRAHIACLDFHKKQVQLSHLTLHEVDGNFMYGFFIEHKIENYIDDGNERYFGELNKHMESYKGMQIGGASLESITKDPPPDILESYVGKEHFKNVLLIFKKIQVRELSLIPEKPGRCIATIAPKLYHYALGVGTLSFEFHLDEVNVSDFYAFKHMASRNSGQYEIWTIDENKNPIRLFSESRLIDIADKIISGYSTWFLNFYKKKSKNENLAPKPWIDVEQIWFTHFEIYRVHDEEGNQLDSEELARHHEYPGIVAYQRADRSSLDDWINLSVPAMHLANLAQIRAHKGDLYIISENHSICYLPDDPKFVVLQYGETSKWVFLIRCLILYCLSDSHRVLTVLKEELNKKTKSQELTTHLKELKERRMEVQRHRILTISILEHAASMGVSQYADHGLLLKRAFKETGIVQIIDRLQERTEGLAAIQEGITDSLEDIKTNREELSKQRLNLALFMLTVIQLFPCVGMIYTIARGSDLNIWEFLSWILISVIFIGGIIIYYFPPKFLFKRNR